MKELQMMIDRWKQQAEPIKKTLEKETNIYAKIDLARLEKCIRDAELLLNTKQSSDTPPQLNKHDVSGWQELNLVKPKVGQKIVYEGNLYPAAGIYIGDDDVRCEDGTLDKFEKWKPALR